MKDEIFKLVSTIPEGKVTTYGEIARALHISSPKVVGWSLHMNKDPKNIPCHRVVFKDGSLSKGYAFGGERVQKIKLEREGVGFREARVEMSKYLYTFNL